MGGNFVSVGVCGCVYVRVYVCECACVCVWRGDCLALRVALSVFHYYCVNTLLQVTALATPFRDTARPEPDHR